MADNRWNELYKAAVKVLRPRKVSEIIEAGGVAAAIESEYAWTELVRLGYALKEMRFLTCLQMAKIQSNELLR